MSELQKYDRVGKRYRLTLLEDELLRQSSKDQRLIFVCGKDFVVDMEIVSVYRYNISGYVRDYYAPSSGLRYQKYNKTDFAFAYRAADHESLAPGFEYKIHLDRGVSAETLDPGPWHADIGCLGRAVELRLNNGYLLQGRIAICESYLLKLDIRGLPLWVFTHAVNEMIALE